MNQSSRQRAILELIRDEEVTRVSQIAARLGVSDETVRRNIKALVDGGLLTRSHGGVEIAAAAVEAPFRRRMRVQAAAKRAVAEAVAARISDGQTLMIDTGSTTAYVAQALAARQALKVVTNSLEIARHLLGRNDNRVYLAGGEVRPDLSAAVGAEAERFVRGFRADVAILSIGGVDRRAGFTDFDLDEARIARAMAERSDVRIVAADASKFGRRGHVAICEPSEIEILATDAPPAEDVRAWLELLGVELATPGERS